MCFLCKTRGPKPASPGPATKIPCASTRPSQHPSPSPTSSMCHRARSVSLGGFKGIPRPWEIGPVPVHSPPHQTARAKIPARASTDTHHATLPHHLHVSPSRRYFPERGKAVVSHPDQSAGIRLSTNQERMFMNHLPFIL